MRTPEEQTPAHRPCLGCGQPARWLVVAPYDPGADLAAAPTGRLLAHCDHCRRDTRETGADEAGPRYSVVLPISVLDVDAEATMRLLYGARLTASDPEQTREHLGLEPGAWLRFAREQVQAYEIE